MYDLSFSDRLALLIGLLTIIALFELVVKGRKARRWAEYAFLVGAAIAGAMVGAVNDSLTVRLSPEYFVIGKGLASSGDRLLGDAVVYGAKAGFSAGIFFGALFLVTNSFGRLPSLSVPHLARLCLYPVAVAIGMAIVMGLTFHTLGLERPLDIDGQSPTKLRALNTVWGIHLGLYGGAVVGTVIACVTIARERAAHCAEAL